MASEQKRMQLRGLHHVTAICADPERTIAFYRDLLGLAIMHDAPSDDDPESRHIWFGALDGRPRHARLLHALPGAARRASSASARRTTSRSLVDSAEEQEAWRDYLRGQGVECSEVFDRGAFRSIYLRDPDNHIVEIATSGPGFTAGGPSA